jgi:hypothetical protein
VAADGLPRRAGDLAGPVWVGGQRPAELVQHHVMVPPAVILEVVQAGAAAVGPVHHVVCLAPGRGLVAAAQLVFTHTKCSAWRFYPDPQVYLERIASVPS